MGLVPTQTTQTLVNGEAAVLAECSNASGSIGTICIQSTYSTLDNKGSVTGVQANAAIAPVFHPQDGEVLGRLAVGSAFDAQGVFYGVFGQAIADEIDNIDFNRTSYALGGRFEGRSPTDSTLDLDGTGTYWVGGAFGRVSGTINNTPSSGAVAGIIGVDDSEGSYKAVGYDKLTAVLIEAVKEQQSLLEKQQEEIAVLREGLRSLRAKAD